MLPRWIASVLCTGAATVGLVAAGHAGPPDPATSTCDAVVITQAGCPKPACLAAIPPIARLCPSGVAPLFDTVTMTVTVRDAANVPCPGIALQPVVLAGNLNLATGGFTTAVTNAVGTGSITVSRGGGCGILAVCAFLPGAVPITLCRVMVRSPDVNSGPLAAHCVAPQGTVNASDVTNGTCGFLPKFGPVVVGVNDCWDLDCNGAVNASDVNGSLCVGMGLEGGWVQHFGHVGALGAQEVTCP